MKKLLVLFLFLFLFGNFVSAESSYVQRVYGSCESDSFQDWKTDDQSASYSVKFDYARNKSLGADSLFYNSINLGYDTDVVGGYFDGWFIVDKEIQKSRDFPYTQDCSEGCLEDATYDSNGWSKGVYHGWNGFLDYGCIDQICNIDVKAFQEAVADTIICDCNKTIYHYDGEYYSDESDVPYYQMMNCSANITYTEVWNGTPIVPEGVVCKPCKNICKAENMVDEINVSVDGHRITLKKKEGSYKYEYDGLDDDPIFVNSVSVNFDFDDSTRKTIFTILKRFEGDSKAIDPRLLQEFLEDHPEEGETISIKENVGWDSEAGDFKLVDDHTSNIIFLDDPCPEVASFLVIWTDVEMEGEKIPIPEKTIPSKDFIELKKKFRDGLSDSSDAVEKWIYGKVGTLEGCFKVAYEEMENAVKEYNSVKVTSTLNKELNVVPEEITIEGNKEIGDVIPIIIGEPEKEIANVFENEESCERWAIWNSWALFWEMENIPISGLIFSEDDVIQDEVWVRVKNAGGEASCEKAVKQDTPSKVSCGIKAKDPFDLDVTPPIPDVEFPTSVPPEACEGFEIVTEALTGEQKRLHEKALRDTEIDGMEFAEKYRRGYSKLQAKLKILAAKTYPTKEKCEEESIYVNWHPGMNLVDLAGSLGLKKFINAHIKDSGYGGGTKGMRDKLPKEEYYEFLTEKDIDISFGWSSGALGWNIWGEKNWDKTNAVNNLKLTYSKRPDIKKLGLFLYDPTGWDETDSGYFDNIPVDKFPTGIILLSRSKDLWKKSGDSRLIEIDLLNDYTIEMPGLSSGHFGVSNILIKEIFKIYVDGLANDGTKASIEALIRNLLEANKGYRGGNLKSPISSTVPIIEDEYAEAEKEYEESGKEYAMLDVKEFVNDDFEERFDGRKDDIQDQLLAVNNYLQYIDFAEMMFDEVPFEEFPNKGFYKGYLPDYDNDSIATIEDETPFGEIV